MTLVTNIQRENTVQLNKPDVVNREIQIQICTFAEPKAVPTQYAYQPQVDEAIDDNGNAMTPETQSASQGSMQSGQGIGWNGYFQLPYPPSNPGKRIAKIRGHMAAIAQFGSEPIDITDPLKAAETTKTVGGQRITFKSLKKRDNGQYILELVYYRDGRDQNVFNQLYNTKVDLKLIDAKDGRYQFYNAGGHGDGESITREFNFSRRSNEPNAPEPTKLTIQVPTATQPIDIPFELVDLPMP
jgi:hypothetical protein